MTNDPKRLPLVGLPSHGRGTIGKRVAPDRTAVALVRPPLRVAKASYSTLACPPLALAYLASSLREAGIGAQIIDAVGEAPRRYYKVPDRRFLGLGLTADEIADRIAPDTGVIGVTCMFSESWPLVREVVRTLRSRFPDLPVVIGGEHATALPELTLRSGVADVVALGEGEDTIVELTRALQRGTPLEEVRGIAFLRDGELVRTPSRARIRAIDAIPRPAWDLLPLETYLHHGLAYGIGRQRSMPILATRGCPYQCTFCSSPAMWTTKWVARAPDDVLDEMEEAIEVYRAENFDFYDLTAILKKEWLIEFCTKMIERRIDVTWQIPSGTRSEALDSEVLPLLARTGVRHIVYAPESGSQAVLERVKKRVKLERMKQSMAEAAHAGLSVKCNLIVGFPDETFDEALDTVKLCRDLAAIGVTDVNIGPFCPYPGSELYDELMDNGTLSIGGDEYFDMLAMYSDLSHTRSWSKHMSHRQVTIARFLGMAEFYGLAFAHRPRRFLELPRNVVTGRHQTRLDRALGDMFRRVGDSIRPASA
jgi:anaerobic magnesium-protoporphyrin IX monomethyl ester cyclase